MHLTLNDLDTLALGCGVLGSGGGGETATGVLMAWHAIERFGPVPVVSFDELADDALIMPCGLIGAPTVSTEKVPGGSEGEQLVEQVERVTGRRVAALMCMEAAGTNGLVPVAWAATTGLPLVDADGIGRAFPLLSQSSMALAEVPVCPVVLTDEQGYAVTLDGGLTPEAAERHARSAAVAMGGRACVALYLMDAATARTATVGGTISRALTIGSVLREDEGRDPFAALQRLTKATPLIRAKVIDVERRTDGGFMRGSTLLEGLGDDTGRLVRIEFQNENLVAVEDGEIIGATPDLISILDETSAEAIATEELHFGHRVVAATLPCDPIWRSEAGLQAVGPASFGYELVGRTNGQLP